MEGLSSEGGPRRPGRSSATTSHRMALDDTINTEIFGGNKGVLITARWRCQQRQCRNYTNTCWHEPGRDGPQNHLKLDSTAIGQWADLIDKGEANVQDIPPVVVVRAMRAQESKRRSRSQPLMPATPFMPPYWGSWGPPPYGVAPPQAYVSYPPQPVATSGDQPPPAAAAAADPPSSPIQLEESPSRQLAGFFTWLEAQPSSGSSINLTRAHQILAEGEWDLEGIRNGITTTQWASWGLPEGLFQRLRREVRRYRGERLAVATRGYSTTPPAPRSL